jgi:hypothetical protein
MALFGKSDPQAPRRRSEVTGQTMVDESTNPVTEPTLDELEAIVSAGLNSVSKVGLALQAIKDRELYRPQFVGWISYLDERWRITTDYAQKLIAAGTIAKKILDAGLPEPTHTAHARALATVKPEAVTEVWKGVLAEVGTVDNVTAEAIEKHAAKHRKRKARRKAPAAIRLKGKGWCVVISRKSIDLDPMKILAEVTEQLTQRAAKKAA